MTEFHLASQPRDCSCPILFSYLLVLGAHPALIRANSQLYAQELVLALLRGPEGMLGMKFGSVTYEARDLLAVLFSRPIYFWFVLVWVLAYTWQAQRTIWERTQVSCMRGESCLHCSVAPVLCWYLFWED